ncbi:MAG: hypothetical protein AAFX41_09880 [Bacteroidota bacterium]
MSTYLYAKLVAAHKQAPTPTQPSERPDDRIALTSARSIAPTERSSEETPSQPPPVVGKYTAALLALIPSEVLVLHTVFMSLGTAGSGKDIAIEESTALLVGFITLVILSLLLYVIGARQEDTFEGLDYVRMFIPPLAFVGWCFLEPLSVIDGFDLPEMETTRTAIGTGLAILVTSLATLFSFEPPTDDNQQASTTGNDLD